MHYRCYFMNMHSHIERVEMIEADTDAEAIAAADAIFREKGAGFAGMEVWDRGRRIGHVLKDRPEQIRRWRMKAEELRTAAEGFTDSSARLHLQNSAATYEALANAAEARAEGRKNRESDAG